MAAPRHDFHEGDLFVGEDVQIDMEVIDLASIFDPVTGLKRPPDQWTPIDVGSGYTFQFDLRDKPTSQAIKISATCSVVGTFAATRALNTQRVRAALTDDQTSVSVLGLGGGRFWYSFKRTDAGAERIALYGEAPFTRATQA